MRNFILKFKRKSYLQLTQRLIHSARKLNPKFLLKKLANKMAIFLELERLFLSRTYFSIIVINVQFCKHSWYVQTISKNKTGKFSLTITYF